MLRDAYAYGTEELKQILKKFATDDELVDVKAFTMLTPDSFLWRLRMSHDSIYYLYAEDYYSDLAYVRTQIEEAAGGHTGEFILLKGSELSSRSDAVKELAKHVHLVEDERDLIAKSGYDKVLLYKSTEQAE